jgi:hypothetical protein
MKPQTASQVNAPQTGQLDIAVREPQPLAVQRSEPSVAMMLAGVLEKGITPENAAAAGELMKLYERMEDRKAERDFAVAFVALQAEMQNVRATRAVPGNDGGVRYHFAPFEEIMAEVGPRLKAHGFTVTFSTDFGEGRLIKICRLQHVGGHSKENKFAVRVGQGPPKASECQADGAASTYAKRFALCDALCIVIDKDTDADPRAEGKAITAEQAASLRERVRATASDETAFLKFAGSHTYEAIMSGKYAVLDASLRRKERTT